MGVSGGLALKLRRRSCGGRITQEFLEDELASIGAAWVKREYFCVFVDSGANVFDRQLVEDAVSEDVAPLTFAI